jgi:hypothetical protein
VGNAELPVSARISLRAALNGATVMPGIPRRSGGMAEDRVREKHFNLHATYSLVFLTGAAFCDRSRFCSSSSGARLIGSCTIARARAVSRRTRTRDSSSNSSGPKTSKTIIENENHSLIAPHFSARLAQKSPQDRAGTRCAVADQRHRVKSEACGDPVHIFLRCAAKVPPERAIGARLSANGPPGERQANSRFWARSRQVIVARGVSKADRHLRAPTRWSDDVSH